MTRAIGRRGAGRLIIACVLAVAAALWAAGPAFAAVSITVSKTTGLNPAGEKVVVKGVGFRPGIQLYLVTCNPAIPNGGACDLANFSLVNVKPDGSWVSTLKVAARFGTVNCLTTACAIQTSRVGNGADTSQEALAALTFTGQTVPPYSGPVVVTASPSASPAASVSPSAPDSSAPSANSSGIAAPATSSSSGTSPVIWIVIAVVVVALVGGAVAYSRRKSASH
jgi:hypothetical protein